MQRRSTARTGAAVLIAISAPDLAVECSCSLFMRRSNARGDGVLVTFGAVANVWTDLRLGSIYSAAVFETLRRAAASCSPTVTPPPPPPPVARATSLRSSACFRQRSIPLQPLLSTLSRRSGLTTLEVCLRFGVECEGFVSVGQRMRML
jgi:hypothetical protein